ncbi:DUF488 family protein [Sphingosinithalassobacter sp. CS137]|uniref:DUF488 domain-containing protein n=1 Tax=Sphingosinithalassobacter sp. CS137 TaxID=2762748 RepID=UPI00165E52C5|nr:DUF488 domain-containing protein [Sphingosinithalassobacter sp. CS137]
MLATIGYERSTLSDFIATLQLAGVELLVDVRERAQSRRPGFSKKSLAEALKSAGIEYLHLPQLGDPKSGREAARSGNMTLFLQIFNGVMKGTRAQEALGQLEKLAAEKHICLMCFERDQRECHRKIVAENLEIRLGVKATHWGVALGAGNGGADRRVLHIDQGAAASI